MRRKATKIAAALLSAVLILQSGLSSVKPEINPALQVKAEEQTAAGESQEITGQADDGDAAAAAETQPETQAPTEAQTQPPTEAQTQAATEAQTQPPTEAQTQAATEAQTQPPTEAQTQPPTEAQTQAPTEAQTQAATEAQTQPPTEAQTEAQTQAPTEAQTQPPTEAQTQPPTEAQTSEETERSERKNDGEKMKASDLAAALNTVLPYFLAAETVIVPDAFTEALGLDETQRGSSEDRLVLQGTEGAAVTSGLEKLSVKLANAKSSSDVEIINLYADKNGKLDTKQLDEQFADQVIDVTKKYFVVNIIADDVKQNLDFSGFEMKLSGEKVIYKEETQPGDILYNFAAMDGDDFTEYRGTVKLKSNLQGTFLAPQAEVKIEADLAGAVFARTITVSDAVKELLPIVFVDGKSAAETDTEEAVTESSEIIEETVNTETVIETEEVTEFQTETAETEFLAEITETETELMSESEEVTEESEEIAATETDLSETEEDTEESQGSEETVLDMVVEDSLDTMEWYSADGIIMKVLLNDTANDTDSETVAGSDLASVMNVEIKAGEVIRGSDGSVIFEKNAVVKSQEYSAEESADLGKDIQYSGIYYIDVTETGTEKKYLDTARIYFEIDAEGNAAFKAPADQGDTQIHAGGNNWNDTEDELTIHIIQKADYTAEPNHKCLTISVVDSSDNTKQITSAAFVIKDSSGNVLTDEQGYPLYYVDYTGSKAVLNLEKLKTDNIYYLSQLHTEEGYLIDTVDKRIVVEENRVVFKEAADGESEVPELKEIVIQNSPASQAQNTGTLTVTARTYYNDVLLTAEQKSTHYVALFAENNPDSGNAFGKRISEVKVLEYEPGTTETKPVTFAGLAQNTTEEVKYYLAETSEFGVIIPASSDGRSDEMNYKIWNGTAESNKIVFAAVTDPNAQKEQKTAQIDFYFDTAKEENYPEIGYSYPAEVTVTKEVLDLSGAVMNSDETFYFNIFRTIPNSSELGETVLEQPAAIVMDGAASASVSVSIKMNANMDEFAIREVDKKGTVLTTDTKDFQYAVSYPENPNGRFTISCVSAKDENDKATGVVDPIKLTIENRKTASLVKLQAEDIETGALISGVTLVVKDKSGKVVLINGKETLTSGAAAIELENVLTPGETYYLSALQAPNGYGAVPDVSFIVNKSGETIVSLQYRTLETTDYKLTVSKQVYSGKYPVYAYDTTNGSYAAKGAYTFYVALFADSARIQKVSDVQKITVSALGGTTVFKNLEKGQTYYVGETDQYGQLKRSTTGLSVKYASKGVVNMTEKSKTTIIQNSYSSLPGGYRYTGTLTITKKVTSASGAAAKVTDTFYAGIYRTEDFSDKPTVVKLDLKDTSSASVKRRILLSGSKDMVYYIAEVDAQGNRITEDSDFTYNVKIDNPTVTVAKGANASVTITNQVKATKATLYLTKKVYNGTAQQSVNETFYAGLFKDPQFTKPYTKPIALKLEGKSELTLKLSLNLGTASNVKIYIAEVDADGNVIRDEKNFGYEIKLINSTAEFTQERREVQTILLNSMFGTATKDDWNTIFSSDGNDMHSIAGDGDYWGISGNGDASEAAQTGDETPILLYAVLMAGALLVLTGEIFRRKRT